MNGPVAEVLGPVRLPDPTGAAATVPGALARRLVVALALAGAEGRSASALADDIWADAPRNPRAALQMLVSRLRASTADGLIASTPAGYRLGGSDLAEAEAVAIAAAGDGDLVDAARVALATWRGDPGDDVEDPVLGGALADRAARARRRLLERRAEALLRLHRPEEALADARSLADTAGPAATAPVALTMRALAAAGRAHEAAAVFAAHRREIRDLLGTGPAADLVALNASLLREDGPAAPALSGVRAPTTALLGREADLARLGRLVASGRLTTVLGPGGIGKTRLATEFARTAAGVDRVVFVELAGVTDPGDLPTVLAAAAGVRDLARVRLADAAARVPHDARARLRDSLADGHVLLVLDNCEHLIDGVAAETAAMLADLPRMRVLTTSRVPLAITGEYVHLLAPLPADAAGAALFQQRAEAARPGVRLDLGLVRRVCARLDGLPLAIELAAARMRTMSLSDLDRRLDDRFAVLVGVDRSAPERHRTLLAVIDWSRRLLAEPDQEALRLLAAFPDGFTEEAATIALGRPAGAALDELVSQSLLTVTEPAAGGTRYRMLETIRDFGLRAAAEHGETARAHEGVDRWLQTFSRRLLGDVRTLTSIAGLRATTAELETLLASVRRPSTGRAAAVIEAFALLGMHCTIRDRHEEVITHGEALLTAWRRSAPRSGPTLTASLAGASVLAITAAFLDPAHSQRAVGLLRTGLRHLPAGDTGYWTTIARLTIAATTRGPVPALLEEAIASTMPETSVLALAIRGAVAENRGDPAAALRDHRAALRIAIEHGLDWNRMVAETAIAQLELQRGDQRETVEHATAALRLTRAAEADDRQVRWILAVARATAGDLDAAEADLRAMLDPATQPQEPNGDLRQLILTSLADIATRRGDRAEAGRLWAAARTEEQRDDRDLPWSLLATAGGLIATTVLHPEPTAEVLADATERARRLRGRLLALQRVTGDMLDVPILGSGLIGIAAYLRWPGRLHALRPVETAAGDTVAPDTDTDADAAGSMWCTTAVELGGLGAGCQARRDVLVIADAADRLRLLDPETFDRAAALPRAAGLARATALLHTSRTAMQRPAGRPSARP